MPAEALSAQRRRVYASPLHSASGSAKGYFTAIAFGGEPTPPGMFNGAEVKKKS